MSEDIPSIAIPSFQHYQNAFTAYIRDPVAHAKPDRVAAKGMDVYKKIVFNNLFESLSACFPVAQKVMGKRAWLNLIREFFRNHAANTPIFRKIPEELLTYLTNLEQHAPDALPVYLTSLCHYEWIELLVSTMPDNSHEPTTTHAMTNAADDLLANQPAFNPTMQLLHYQFAVNKISPRYKPQEKVATYLLAYRNAEYLVKFIELNPITYRLIDLLKNRALTGKEALTIIADDLADMLLENVMAFGLEILTELKTQGVVLGLYHKA